MVQKNFFAHFTCRLFVCPLLNLFLHPCFCCDCKRLKTDIDISREQISQGKWFFLCWKVRENEFCRVVGTMSHNHECYGTLSASAKSHSGLMHCRPNLGLHCLELQKQTNLNWALRKGGEGAEWTFLKCLWGDLVLDAWTCGLSYRRRVVYCTSLGGGTNGASRLTGMLA